MPADDAEQGPQALAAGEDEVTQDFDDLTGKPIGGSLTGLMVQKLGQCGVDLTAYERYVCRLGHLGGHGHGRFFRTATGRLPMGELKVLM